MHIAAFESPLVAASLSHRVCAGLNTNACPDGSLEHQKDLDLSGVYTVTAEWSETQPGYALNMALQSWGIAQVELDYQEDMVCEYTIDSAITTRYSLPALASYTEPYVSPCPVFDTLAALLSYVRCYFTIDTQLYWGKIPQGYVGIALYVLKDPELKVPDPPFVPMFDLHLAQPYSALSAQLIEEAGAEWALRHLPASLSERLKDPRPLVTLGAQPYYQQVVSQPLLKVSRWKPSNQAKQAEKSTRSVWETFLIPHQQLAGYLQQWQEILYRFLPLYCQWSEQLAQQSEVLQRKQLLSPYFERSVTPMGRLAIEMESLRGLAQARLIQNPDQTLTARDLLRWPEFSRRWQLFLNDYGHCGALDLAQPRLHEQGEFWLNTLLIPWCEGRPISDLSWVQRLQAGRLWKDYEALYTLREKLWSDTLWALDQVKRRISAATSLTFQELCLQSLEGLLRDAESVNVSEEMSIITAVEHFESVSDFDGDRLQGRGLQTGLAQGVIWHGSLAMPRLPEGYQPSKTILCLSEVEAVHLPLIQQVSGVLLTRGNPWSQGSHLLREWNKPAIVQIPEAQLLAEGTPVRLNSETGVVDILDALS